MKYWMVYLWNFWPPFFGAGIKIDHVSPGFREIHVKLRKRPWTANYIGTQYGGSIFSMIDPFYMVMLMKNLGPQYSVIDEGAQIDFIKLGRTELSATCKLEQSDLNEIKERLKTEEKISWARKIDIYDTESVVVASIVKVIRIRLRPNKK